MSNIEKKNGEIESNLNDAVKKSIINTYEEAKFFFKHEYEIHGYLRCQLHHCFKVDEKLKDLTDLIIPECPTKLVYHRDSGTDNGIVYKSLEYQELQKLNHEPKPAKFDFAIWNPERTFYNEKGRINIPKVIIGIEIKRQRNLNLRNGEKKEDLREELIKGLIEDCKKLNDAGNKIKYKYLLIFMYYPEIFTLDLKKELINNINDINIVYCEINKQEKIITNILYFPDKSVFITEIDNNL
ncbi:MAG: hypothetical protein OIN89_11140 [Candidatus Methanoperedens sp.]|jgi:hypothetical protein|nr:hypothetical protein [Candidatus Methanoperedens sp.]PKL53094.1 MAG: hypothetical protein CVV36_08810 [Candidatus Methanoperedenaceae archaeon HGW-Methanoperedenaceae-1]